MPTVTFQPAGVVAQYRPGETLFSVALRSGVSIETACVGKGTCGLCRVKITSGAEHLSECGPTDEKHLGNVYWLTRVRLACQAELAGGDVTIEVPPPKSSQ